MKTYLRLFVANPVTRYSFILLLISALLTNSKFYSVENTYLHYNISLLFCTSLSVLFATVLGLDSLRSYNRFMKAHLAGKRKITEWEKSVYPCTNAALKLARKDIEKLEKL